MKTSNIIFLFASTMLLALPASYEPEHFAKALFAGALAQSFALSSIILFFIHRYLTAKRIIISLFYLLCSIETFLFLRFGSRLDPNMLTLALQTNINEVNEFFSVYLAAPFTFIFLAVALSLYFILYKSLGINTVCNSLKYKYANTAILVGTIIGLAPPFLPINFPIGKNTPGQLIMSVDFVVERHADVNKMTDCIDEICITASPEKEDAPIIVLVIGESFNKQHSSLYGYYLPTSPYLQKEVDSGHLFCFTNAMSPTNGTDFAMRYIFSLKGCESTENNDIHEFMLMPAIFKKAGYNVAYFDNQYTRASGGSLDFSCGYFLNPIQIHSQCFDYRNEKTTKYDGDFISQYSNDLLYQPKSLNIIHLKGQHFDAALRYPESFDKFKPEDINQQALDESQKQQVAHYDNATLYNDYVLKSIIDGFRNKNAIIIYLSDHGEQIYDEPSHFFGRGFDTTNNEETIKAVYQVPFMIWCSSEYINKSKEIVKAIQEIKDSEICTADIAYLLFDIADIDFNYNIRTKSFIDSTFIPHKVIIN
ncbi:MAG: sulfatase-like hydrolase/transferase [Bacteroidaceae bacterium]|nr:sulfatase-like hydrolase/transferase [Bacteroidaceae bacterium]